MQMVLEIAVLAAVFCLLMAYPLLYIPARVNAPATRKAIVTPYTGPIYTRHGREISQTRPSVRPMA